MANARALGTKLAALRRARGETQAVAAEAIGIERPSLAMIETGRDLPGRDLLIAMATYYGESLDALVAAAGTGDPGALTDEERDLLAFWRTLEALEREQLWRVMRAFRPPPTPDMRPGDPAPQPRRPHSVIGS